QEEKIEDLCRDVLRLFDSLNHFQDGVAHQAAQGLAKMQALTRRVSELETTQVTRASNPAQRAANLGSFPELPRHIECHFIFPGQDGGLCPSAPALRPASSPTGRAARKRRRRR